MLALVLVFTALQQQPCQPGTVLEVSRGRDYILDICGVGMIALRGAEPPLAAATGLPPLGLKRPTSEFNLPISGELLGGKDVGPEGVAFLQNIVAGKRVTIVEDGWRVGDPGGRRYMYVFLPDKTLLNAELIKRGYAYADRQGSHPRRDEFFALEEAARRQRVGVWAP